MEKMPVYRDVEPGVLSIFIGREVIQMRPEFAELPYVQKVIPHESAKTMSIFATHGD